jgi:hypothetical protein
MCDLCKHDRVIVALQNLFASQSWGTVIIANHL